MGNCIQNKLLRMLAAGAYLSSFTTFLIWLFAFIHSQTSASNLIILNNPYYQAKLWMNLMNIPLSIMAYAGLTWILVKRNAFKPIVGMIWCLISGLIEMGAVLVLLINEKWRVNYFVLETFCKSVIPSANSPFAFSGTLAEITLFCSLIGALFLSWATWSDRKPDRAFSGILFSVVLLTGLMIITDLTHNTQANSFVKWIYPLIQPTSRLAIGLYIWSHTWRTYHFPRFARQ